MDIKDLKKDFKKITGDDISPQTLRRWADEGIIMDHRDNRANIGNRQGARGRLVPSSALGGCRRVGGEQGCREAAPIENH